MLVGERFSEIVKRYKEGGGVSKTKESNSKPNKQSILDCSIGCQIKVRPRMTLNLKQTLYWEVRT